MDPGETGRRQGPDLLKVVLWASVEPGLGSGALSASPAPEAANHLGLGFFGLRRKQAPHPATQMPASPWYTRR